MPIPPNWLSLKIFVAACETGNVARAAEICAIAPSAAARRIQDLESQLGVQLFDRTSRGVRPTLAGRTLLATASDVLQAGNVLLDRMAAHASGQRITVRLDAATSAIAGHDLATAIASFPTAELGIAIDLCEASSQTILRNVCDGTAHLGIATLPGAPPERMRAAPWRHDRLAVVLPAAHPLARRPELRFVDLLEEVLIGIVPSDTLATRLAAEAAKLGRPLRLGFRVATADAALHLVGSGQGVSIMPDCLIHPRHEAERQVVAVALEEDWALRTLYLIGPNAANTSPALDHVWTHLLTDTPQVPQA